MKTRNRKRRIFKNMYIAILLAFVVLLFLSYDAESNKETSSNETQGILTNWVDDNNNLIKLKGISGNINAYNILPEDMDTNKSLCFASHDVNFKIYVYGKCIYEYTTDRFNATGKSNGSVWHFVDVPENSRGKLITIECSSIYNDASASIYDIVISDAGYFALKIVKNKMPAVLICISMVVLGVLLIFIDLSISENSNEKHSLMFLGLFSVICSIWSATETLFLQLLFSSEIINMLNSLTFILLPFPIIGFINVLLDFKSKKLIHILETLTIFAAILCVLLNTFRIMDYHESIFIIQGVILVVLVSLTGNLILNSKKSNSKALKSIYVKISIFILVVTSIIDLIRYNIKSSGIQDASAFLRMGMVVFILLMGAYVFQSIGKSYNDNCEAMVLQRLAYIDGLTELENKSSFVNYMTELSDRDNKSNSITIIQFDINNLKPVNDKYGHLTGDDFIKSCSKIISESFKQSTRCFRTGGDEFVAVIVNDNSKELAVKQLKNMETKLQEYNLDKSNSFRMEIASGMATYDSNTYSSIYDVLQEADSIMYSNKRNMKKS